MIPEIMPDEFNKIVMNLATTLPYRKLVMNNHVTNLPNVRHQEFNTIRIQEE